MEFEKDEDGNEIIYEVEAILAKEIMGDKLLYFIKWKGYDDNWNSWEEASYLECPDAIKDFEERLEATRKQEMEAKKKKMTSATRESDDADEEKDTSFGAKKKTRPHSARKTASQRKSNNSEKKRFRSLEDCEESTTERLPITPVKTSVRPNIRDSKAPSTHIQTNGDIPEPKIQEMYLDPEGDMVVSYHCPEESRVRMMYYKEFKESHASSLLDYLESNLSFKELGTVQRFKLIDPS
jgi:hypothetical protein